MNNLHPLFAQILAPFAPPESEKLPCGLEPGDCSAAGSGCLWCGDNPNLDMPEEPK